MTMKRIVEIVVDRASERVTMEGNMQDSSGDVKKITVVCHENKINRVAGSVGTDRLGWTGV